MPSTLDNDKPNGNGGSMNENVMSRANTLTDSSCSVNTSHSVASSGDLRHPDPALANTPRYPASGASSISIPTSENLTRSDLLCKSNSKLHHSLSDRQLNDANVSSFGNIGDVDSELDLRRNEEIGSSSRNSYNRNRIRNDDHSSHTTPSAPPAGNDMVDHLPSYIEVTKTPSAPPLPSYDSVGMDSVPPEDELAAMNLRDDYVKSQIYTTSTYDSTSDISERSYYLNKSPSEAGTSSAYYNQSGCQHIYLSDEGASSRGKDNPNKIMIGIDLKRAARRLISFLSLIDTCKEFYEGPTVDEAIRRYV